jgi:hypothetical protein
MERFIEELKKRRVFFEFVHSLIQSDEYGVRSLAKGDRGIGEQ